jgi:hypothetical protein
METQFNGTPLSPVTVLEGYTIEHVTGQERHVLRYTARDKAGHHVVLVEFFPHEFVKRDSGQRVTARSAEDVEALQGWMRGFAARAKQLAGLNHPGLEKVRQIFAANGTCYYVAEALAGETLATVLARDGSMPEPKLRQLLNSQIDALGTAHAAGLLHGDIEPSKLWLQFDGKAVLTGFASEVTPIRLKAQTVINAGTAGYSPPEHLLVQAAEQPSSDIYSLAAVAYRAICGEAPPEARLRGAGAELKASALAAQGRYSAALTNAIDAGLAMRPQQRPQTLAQWQQLLDTEEAAAQAVAPKQTQQMASASSMRWVAAPAALAVLAAGYFVVHGLMAPKKPTAVLTAPEASAPTSVYQQAAPAAASTLLQAPTLDQLAISMLKKGGKKPSDTVTPPPRQPVAAAPGVPPGTPAAAGRPPATAAAPTPASPTPVAAAPAPGKPTSTATPGAAPPAAASRAAPPATTAPAPSAAPSAAAEAEKQHEEPLTAQKAAEQAAADKLQKENAAKDAAAAKEAAKALQERIRRAVARAKSKCEIPAPELSENENLVYENATAVPGAVKQKDGTVRLPEVTLADGSTAVFVIDEDSCAHRQR